MNKSIAAAFIVVVVVFLMLLLRVGRLPRSGVRLWGDWFGGKQILIGAAFPERLDLIVIAVWIAIAWLIGLVVAEGGVLGAAVLFLYLGLGAAEIALIVYLVVRLVRRVRGKAK